MKKLTPLLLSLLLSACGGSAETPAAPDKAPPSEATPTPEASTPALSMAELLAGMPEEPMPADPEALTRAQRDGESIVVKEAIEAAKVEPTPAPSATPPARVEPSTPAEKATTKSVLVERTATKKPTTALSTTAEPNTSASITESASTLSVESASVAKKVVDRQPVGQGPFGDGGTVWTWSRILNPEGKRRTIRHVYYREGRQVVAVPLAIKGASWRTWSRTGVHGTGNWRVDIVDENDQLLKSLPFVVE